MFFHAVHCMRCVFITVSSKIKITSWFQVPRLRDSLRSANRVLSSLPSPRAMGPLALREWTSERSWADTVVPGQHSRLTASGNLDHGNTSLLVATGPDWHPSLRLGTRQSEGTRYARRVPSDCREGGISWHHDDCISLSATRTSGPVRCDGRHDT